MKEKIRKAFGGSSFKYGTFSVILTAVVLAIVVVINLLVAQLPSSLTSIDISEAQLYSIGDTTTDLVSKLDQDITIYVLASEGSEDETVEQMLQKYADLSSHITIKDIDPDHNPALLKQYDITTDDLSSSGTDVLVVSAKRYKLLSYSDIYTYTYGSNAYYYYMMYQDSSYLATSYNGEKLVTSAISYVTTDDIPKMYTLTGHDEVSYSTTITSLLSDNNYEVAELNLMTADTVPDDCDVLAIIDPSSDFTEAEVEALEDYVAHGGDCIIINYSDKQADMPNYCDFLAYYGVYIPSGGYIFEPSGYNYNQYAWALYEPLSSSHSIATSVESTNAILSQYAQPIYQYDDKRSTLTIESFLTTSDGAWLRTDLESTLYSEKIEGDVDGPFDLGVVITDQTDEGEGKIVLYSTCDLISSSYVDGNYPFANAELFMSSVNYLCSLSTTISISAKSSSIAYNTATSSQYYIGLLVFVIIIPVVLLIMGFVVWFRRRRR